MAIIPIYDNICRIAREKGTSINTVEKECSLGIGSLCKWNVSSPTVRNLKKVADYLGTPIETLLEEEK